MFLLASSVEGATVTEDNDISGNGRTSQSGRMGVNLPHMVCLTSLTAYTH